MMELKTTSQTKLINSARLNPGMNVERSKYTVSHYLVRVGATVTENTGGYQATDNELVNYSTPRLGGVQFHNRVRKAAEIANKEFLTLGNGVSVEDLMNAFYTVLYNARVVYSSLLAAYRCQCCVNAKDEDSLYLNFLLSDRTLRRRAAGYGISYLATAVNLANRQGTGNYVSFSNPISNAAWAQMWNEALMIARMPRGWKRELESMFPSFHLVVPTANDLALQPELVAFWPDMKLVYQDSLGNWQCHYDPGQPAYSSRTVGTSTINYYVYNNVGINDLQTMIANAANIYSQLMVAYPQLETMFAECDCSVGTEFDYNRDIASHTVRVTDSPKVRSFIRSVCLSSLDQRIALVYGMATTQTIHPHFDVVNANPEVCYIHDDPKFQVINAKDWVGMQKDANFVYVDRVEFSDGQFVLWNGHVAPLGKCFIDMSGTNPGAYSYSAMSNDNVTRDGAYMAQAITQTYVTATQAGTLLSFHEACRDKQKESTLSLRVNVGSGSTYGANFKSSAWVDGHTAFYETARLLTLSDFYVAPIDAQDMADQASDYLSMTKLGGDKKVYSGTRFGREKRKQVDKQAEKPAN